MKRAKVEKEADKFEVARMSVDVSGRGSEVRVKFDVWCGDWRYRNSFIVVGLEQTVGPKVLVDIYVEHAMRHLTFTFTRGGVPEAYAAKVASYLGAALATLIMLRAP